ncbi:MAG: DNA polymerase III subunit epsilon [Altererythrobacter sp.]|nr:DNA polymerase III subunit epsilon [Altererythrobacter sp.]|tara:strand:- start:309 stop:1256 length:948 start_codon:yes stop_codon:yes gene_type:complete
MKSLWQRLTGRLERDDRRQASSVNAEDGEVLARRLELLAGYRVLRALDHDVGVERLPCAVAGERVAAVIDCETTGLDVAADRMIEFAAQRFLFGPDGRVRAVERVQSWREDPGGPLPERLVRLTGLTDADLHAHHFDDAAIVALLESVDLIIAHNAAFDRPFVEHRFPKLSACAWACSLSQLDWLELGYDGRALGHLLLQSGHFFEGHRAAQDVVALTTLLSLERDDGRTILWHMLERCERDTFRVEAVAAPYDAKDLLKRRGYRWDAGARYWWREVDEDMVGAECDWLDRHVYRGRGKPSLRRITARDRFRHSK